jgi:hypothetical protein
MSMTLRPTACANRLAGGDSSAASINRSRTSSQSRGACSVGAAADASAAGLLHELDVVAVGIETVLLEKEPIVEGRMAAVRPYFLAVQVGKPVDPAVGPDHKRVVHLIDGLAEIDPAVAAGAVGVCGDMIAAFEFDLAQRHRAMRLARGYLLIIVHVQAVLFPGARFGNDVQQHQMAAGAIGKRDLVHWASKSGARRSIREWYVSASCSMQAGPRSRRHISAAVWAPQPEPVLGVGLSHRPGRTMAEHAGG